MSSLFDSLLAHTSWLPSLHKKLILVSCNSFFIEFKFGSVFCMFFWFSILYIFVFDVIFYLPCDSKQMPNHIPSYHHELAATKGKQHDAESPFG